MISQDAEPHSRNKSYPLSHVRYHETQNPMPVTNRTPCLNPMPETNRTPSLVQQIVLLSTWVLVRAPDTGYFLALGY